MLAGPINRSNSWWTKVMMARNWSCVIQKIQSLLRSPNQRWPSVWPEVVRSQFVMARGQGSSGTIQQLSEGPFDVDPVPQSGDAQFQVVVFGEGGKVGAFDLVLLKALAVFRQADALKPITHVVLVPQVEGPLPPRPQGQQGPAEDWGGAGGGVWRRRWRTRSGSCAGASHHKANLLRFWWETETRWLQDGQTTAWAQIWSFRAGRGQSHWPIRWRGRGRGGGAPAGDGVATSWSDGVAGTVSSLGDSVEFTKTGEQPATQQTEQGHQFVTN